MNGQTPQIKESERVPIDLSINPLRRREQKSKLADNRVIPSKTLSRSQTSDNCENCSNTSTQADVAARPMSGIRIREQASKNAKPDTYCSPEKVEVEKGQSKAEKYNKEKKFVMQIEKDSKKVISNTNITFKSSMKKEGMAFKKNKATNQHVMLPPLEQKEMDKQT